MPGDKKTLKVQRPILEHFVVRIYDTGLLLDEDISWLLERAHIEFDRRNMKISYGGPIIECVVSGGTLAAAFMFFRHKMTTSFFSMTAIAGTPLILATFKRISLLRKLAIQENNLEKMLLMVKNIAQINRMVLEFLNQRNTEAKKVTIFEPYTKSIKELMEAICMRELKVFITMRDAINYIRTIVPCIDVFYGYLDFVKFYPYRVDLVSKMEDCIRLHRKVVDSYILMMSNSLTALGTSMCPGLWASPEVNVDKVLDEIIPTLLKVLTECYEDVKVKFDNAKYYSFNKRNARTPVKLASNNSSKLKVVTYNCLTRTNDIVEKCRHIFERVDNVDTLDLANRQLLRDGINNLCQDVFGCYENLDLLLKSYEVSVLAEKPKGAQLVPVTQEEDPEPVQVIQPFAGDEYDERSSDDEFEAYVGASRKPHVSESSQTFVVENDSSHLMTLLDNELKHALIVHTRSAAARTRRAMIDDEGLPGPSRAEAAAEGAGNNL